MDIIECSFILCNWLQLFIQLPYRQTDRQKSTPRDALWVSRFGIQSCNWIYSIKKPIPELRRVFHNNSRRFCPSYMSITLYLLQNRQNGRVKLVGLGSESGSFSWQKLSVACYYFLSQAFIPWCKHLDVSYLRSRGHLQLMIAPSVYHCDMIVHTLMWNQWLYWWISPNIRSEISTRSLVVSQPADIWSLSLFIV
jgi:hypothetical protein